MNYQPFRDPPAWFHTRILVGPGVYLTPIFQVTRNISHVINCAYEYDSPPWFRLKYPDRYECLNAPDSPNADIRNWLPQFEKAMKLFLREGTGVVYVHCAAGMNRSATLALAYVCKNFYFPMDAMIQTTLRQRPCMFQNPVYMNQVKELLNGRVPSSQNQRSADRDDEWRDIRLDAPGDRTEPARLNVDTGQIEAGARGSAGKELGALREE
jgi:protein-tyrosine phosphatase